MPTFNQLVRKGREQSTYKSTAPALQKGINTLKNKASNYNMNDPRQVAEFVKSNEYLINSLNVTYKLGITFDNASKSYIYPDGTKVTDTAFVNANNTGGSTTPKNIWKNEQNGGYNPDKVVGGFNSYTGVNSYKLGVEADKSGVAKNIPDSAEYLKDGV